MKFKEILIFVACLIKFSHGNLGCRDENGKFIDWIYMTKLPTQKSNGNSEPESGLDFYFLKPNSVEGWIRSTVKINSNQSIPGLLLSQIYTTKVLADSIILLYNDEPPTGKPDGVDGHTKGVIAADFQSGFWLIHSVPKFPPNLEVGYNFPETGQRFGQSFLCISFKSEQMELVGKQILYNEPYVYSSSVPEILTAKYPNLVKASQMVKIKEPPFWSAQNLTSVGGTNFRSFAKTRKFGKELYADWVAPDLQTDLEVETWLNGPGKIASNCSRREHVFNVAEIKIQSEVYTSSHDHSKWAVGGIKTDWICVGDINRAEHQKQRGGGTVCQNSIPVAKVYRKSINQFEPCGRNLL